MGVGPHFSLDVGSRAVSSLGMPYTYSPPPPDLQPCHECGTPVRPDQLRTFDADGWTYCGPCRDYLTRLVAQFVPTTKELR